MAHGMDLSGEAEYSGIHITQQTIAERSLTLKKQLDFARVQFGSRHGLQHAQVIDPVCRDLTRRHQFGSAEKIALKVEKALVACGTKFFVGLDFLGQHVAAPRAIAFDHYTAL